MPNTRPILMLAAFALCASGSAQAGTLYRCAGKDGGRVYSSTAEGYSKCEKLASYTPERAAASVKATAAAVDPAVTVPASTSSGTPKNIEFRTGTATAPPIAPSSTGGNRVVRGSVYRVEKNGIVHYTNVKPGGRVQGQVSVLFTYVETCFACSAKPRVSFQNVSLKLDDFAEEVTAAVSATGVEEALVRAVIHAESAFNPGAQSHKGAQGLMQLIPATASRFGVTDSFTPKQNVLGGTKYLAWLLKRFDGNLQLAAAGYNAGEGAVDRYGGVPPYSETQRYVERVGVLVERYRLALASR